METLFEADLRLREKFDREYPSPISKSVVSEKFDRYKSAFTTSSVAIFIEKNRRFIGKFLRDKFVDQERYIAELIRERLIDTRKCINFVPLLRSETVSIKRWEEYQEYTGFFYPYYAPSSGAENSLDRLLRRDCRDRISWEEWDRIFFQLSYALFIASCEFEYQHNDLKPANLILDRLPKPINLVYDHAFDGNTHKYLVLTDVEYIVRIIDYNGGSTPELTDSISTPMTGETTDYRRSPAFDLLHLLVWTSTADQLFHRYRIAPIERLANYVGYRLPSRESVINRLKKHHKLPFPKRYVIQGKFLKALHQGIDPSEHRPMVSIIGEFERRMVKNRSMEVVNDLAELSSVNSHPTMLGGVTTVDSVTAFHERHGRCTSTVVDGDVLTCIRNHICVSGGRCFEAEKRVGWTSTR